MSARYLFCMEIAVSTDVRTIISSQYVVCKFQHYINWQQES